MGKTTLSLIFLTFLSFSFFQVHPLNATTPPKNDTVPQNSNSTVEWHGDVVSSNTVAVQLLAINEANTKTPSPSIIPQTFDTGKPILAGYLKKVEAKMPGATFFLHAGDQNQIRLSGLPQQSSASETNLFTMLGNSHCRPTGGYDRECNFIGIPGNNEFIQGVQEMLHLLYESRDGQSSYQQNSFPSICTNLVETESEHPVFQPYVVRLVDGVPIGFIGALLKTEHNAELVKNKEHLAIRDEAESVNEYVKILQGLGVHTIVVMIHQGNEKQAVLPSKNLAEHKIRLQTMLAQLDSEVDVVLCGQSHSYNNTLVEGKSGKKMLVVQAWPQENGVAQIQLQISRASAEVVAMRSTVHSTQKGMESYQKKANVASLNAQGQTNTQQPAPSTGSRIAFPENRETM